MHGYCRQRHNSRCGGVNTIAVLPAKAGPRQYKQQTVVRGCAASCCLAKAFAHETVSYRPRAHATEGVTCVALLISDASLDSLQY